MTGFGVFGFLAATLQLSVPSYALRLVRRYGAERVGWFLVLTFSSLALLYLLKLLKMPGAVASGGISLDLVYTIASGLLVIGMGHLETLCSQRQQAEREEQTRRLKWEAEVKEHTAGLTKTNQGLAEEIARRDQREKIIKESEAQYRFLFSENPQPMWILDLRSGRFLAVNQSALEQYGFARQEFLALTAQDLLPVGALAAFQADLARPCSSAQTRGEWQHRRNDGSLLEVELTALDLTFNHGPARLVMIREVGQRRKHEQELCDTSKMEAIRQVTAGVAHYYNNFITVIDAHANILLNKTQDAATAGQLKQISTAANRIAAITRQLLAVSGCQLIQNEPLNLNKCIQDLDPMVRRLLGDGILLQNALRTDLPNILADPHFIEHIVVNLVLNAREAMPSGGSLTIQTAPVRVAEVAAREHLQARPGEFVRLSVRDTGCGMPPEVQTRLFEPFFTTHEVGKGTGLGLASVYGLVKQLGGWLELSSTPGIGTEFRIYFPCASASAAIATSACQKAEPQFRGTILLVQAEARARELARYILTRHGYRVIEADAATTALVLWESQACKVDLLLTDLSLPGGSSGRDLAAQLCQTRPELKVAYFSGNAPDNESERVPLPEGSSFIAKPFTPDKLLQTLQACLHKNA
ncbi:MAG TPA: ATP-binding protein [Candidatus Binatia bacterium]|nr:ATP-binding protein [Candidatus Binatia bacterium]